MATTPYPFVAGAVLTASQLNSTFNIPTTTKTASYVLTAADAGTRVYMNSGSATTITVNTSIFSASDVVEIFNIGAGVTTITAGTATVSTAGSLAVPQYGSGRLTFTATGASIFTPSGVNASPRIGQVVSTNKSDTFSTTSTTFTDITGFSVSITPTLATSKILVLANYSMGLSGDILAYTQLVRGSTALSIGDAAGNRGRVTNALMAIDGGVRAADQFTSQSIAFLDSPATTSATTYKIQMLVNAGTGYFNRTGSDTDNAQRPRGASNITVMEVIV